MTMKTYNVALNEGVDYDEFWYEIENDGSGSTHVPYRAVDIIDERPASLRQCWYELNDTEAEKLRNDPRVFCVEIPPEFRTDIKKSNSATQTPAQWSKLSAPTAYPYAVNWGLSRINSTTNNMTNSTFAGFVDYTYCLDGSGVDVVIMDSGCQIDHPEFTDANGVSRVQQIDWFSASGVAGTMPPFSAFYSDNHGHGTHVTGIAAGKHYGRAKNSRIYIMTSNSLCVPPTIGISDTQIFDCIKGWHNNKPVDPELGYKRPTVVNMSWAYVTIVSSIVSITYRGITYPVPDPNTVYPEYGLVRTNPGVRVLSADVDIAELLAAGVVVVGAAGNDHMTVDVPGGLDYNNYATTQYVGQSPHNTYYMRGPTPGASEGVICVGNVNSSLTTPELKQSDSTSGPRIDIWSPGSNIFSAMSTNNQMADNRVGPYVYNNVYKIASLIGTSMASPNIVGLVAQLLQLFPTATPAQIRQKIIDYSVPNMMYSTGLTTDYSNDASLHGAPNRYAYQPFNGAINGTVTGLSTLPTSIISAPH